MSRNNDWTRRELLRCALASAVGASSLRGALGMLAGVGASASGANTHAGDYRALVCVYLHGANDGFNLLVPRNDGFHAQYKAARGNLALAKADLLAIKGKDRDGREFGLHPSTPELVDLFNAERLAMVANVGTLLQPTSKRDFKAERHLPPNLFSHNSQQDQSMSSQPGSLRRNGWGGLLGERLMSLNENQALSINISLAGNNLFQTGGNVIPYVARANGDVKRFMALKGQPKINARRKAVAMGMLDRAEDGPLFEAHLASLTKRQLALADQVEDVVSSAPELNTEFPADNNLAEQLNTVARLIWARDLLGLKRQVFFVSLGGFDTHNGQLNRHPRLLAQVSKALAAFHSAASELGVGDQVTTFTMSDFGRTLSSNGDGTDHAWGNNMLVLGGAVAGGRVHGNFPDLRIDGPNDSGNGRIIPTISWDQYGATLGRWFGASEGDLRLVFPHLERFERSNLGFMG